MIYQHIFLPTRIVVNPLPPLFQLLTEKEEQLKRINSLLLPKDSNNDEPSDEVIRKTPQFIDIMAKLRASERLTAEHKKEAEKIRENWAAGKGDLDLAKKTLADMERKHERRWAELISQYSQTESAAIGDASNSDGKDLFTNAKKTADLEIKLQQALESVSRMETIRATLNDALKMNEQLQSKLEDLKTKNAKMVAEKAAARASTKEADPLKSPELVRKPSSGDVDPTIEKLQRDYRRARKEVSAAQLSKDQAKLKQEVSATCAASLRIMIEFPLFTSVIFVIIPESGERERHAYENQC